MNFYYTLPSSITKNNGDLAMESEDVDATYLLQSVSRLA